MQNDELSCSCYNTNFAYIFHFYFTTSWQLDVKHKVELFYSLDYIDDYPITFNEEYMVIQYRSSEFKEEKDPHEPQHEDPNLLIYKLNQPEDEEDTNLFFAIYQSEIAEDNFRIVDFELNYEKGLTYLYLLMKKSAKGPGHQKKILVMKKFSLSEYSLEYDLGSYKYRDSANFVATDLLNNKVEFTLHMLLRVNLQIYLFLFMAVAFGVILLVMLGVYILKKKQIRKLKALKSKNKQEELKRNEELKKKLAEGFNKQNKSNLEKIEAMKEKENEKLEESEILDSKNEKKEEGKDSDKKNQDENLAEKIESLASEVQSRDNRDIS